jgi:hypothetical protein
MTFTMVETKGTKPKVIAIRPFFNANASNMGLEKYGLTLYEGVTHYEQLACLENNGVKRYVTGLNEFAPEVKNIQNKEQREAVIAQIRTAVADLEKSLAANYLEIDDPQFWSKVTLLRPDNDEFWSKIDIKCGNDPVFLDPSDPFDLIKIYAINAGGFSQIAKSYEDARSKPKPVKFYLDKFEETIATKTESKKLKNKALSELQKLYDKNANKLFYVAKLVDIAGAQYKKNTPNDVLYDNMDTFINGEGSEKSQSRAAQNFINAADMDMETLKLKCLVKDSIYYKIFVTRSDNFIYHKTSGTMLGRNQEEIVEYLKNPLNEPVLVEITKKVESYWKS